MLDMMSAASYFVAQVIRTFRDRETQKSWETGKSRRLSPQIRKVAQRKLQILDVAKLLEDLLSPPGNRLERLRGERAGQHSIRINDQFHLCFVWRDGDAYEAEITDYH